MSDVNYPVGDFLIQIKNAVMAKNRDVITRSTKQKLAVANTLKDAGFIEKVEVKDGKLIVNIAYHKKQPILVDIRLVSTPGLRVYMGVDEIEGLRGPSIFIISTPKGVVTSKKAIKERVGGEIIAEIF